MLFNSYVYIFLFLPLVLVLYFGLNRLFQPLVGKALLLAASLFFYAWWRPDHLPVLLFSMLANYLAGHAIVARSRAGGPTRGLLAMGVMLNLGLLGVFKYSGFFLANLGLVTGIELPRPHMALPLGISFFTFTQIAFLVDCAKGRASDPSLTNYGLFVTFFPHLLAGPILHHAEMMPQFDRARGRRLSVRNLSKGLSLFALGLFKKVVIADTFAAWATAGFDSTGSLTLLPAWAASVSYTLQLYFDFSGYTDMALGSARMLNITLPRNFDSPYKSVDIQDFWRRWHITLGRFLRDYLYIPLGGSRGGRLATYRNLFLTFLLGGLWHGAGWTFVAWGALHGLALVVHRAWKGLGVRLPVPLAWGVTMLFVNMAWVLFRADSLAGAGRVLSGMAGLSGVVLPAALAGPLGQLALYGVEFGRPFELLGDASLVLPAMVAGALLVLVARNSDQLIRGMTPRPAWAALSAALSVASLLFIERASEFIYFNF